jgi:hypothetical protein
MLDINCSIPVDDQPIGGAGNSATLLHEGRYLTEWFQESLEVQQKYAELTKGLGSMQDKIKACWEYVARGLEYVPYLHVKTIVDGKTFIQKDAWLSPGQVIQAGIGNCANRSFLLTALLQQELPKESVWCVLGNVYNTHREGHAWCLVHPNGSDYILETTQPRISKAFLPIENSEVYEGVVLTNGKEVRYFPNTALVEPLSYCYCVRWLEGYLQERACDGFV